MNKKIKLSDILGQKIVAIQQTAWDDSEGYSVCEVYIKLNTGVRFELFFPDAPADDIINYQLMSDEVLSIAEVQGKKLKECIGQTVKAVMFSDEYPSIGVLTENGLIIHLDSWGPYKVGLCIQPHKESINSGESWSLMQ